MLSVPGLGKRASGHTQGQCNSAYCRYNSRLNGFHGRLLLMCWFVQRPSPHVLVQ